MPTRTRTAHATFGSSVSKCRAHLVKPLAFGIGLALVGLATQSARATSDIWTGATSALWSLSSNWSTNPAIVPGTGDTATFSGPSSFTSLDLGTGITVSNILFDTATAAAYTIGLAGQTLTMDTASAGNAITMNSTVTNNEVIAANVVVAAADSTFRIVNNSAAAGPSITFNGTIQGNNTTAKTVNASGTGPVVLNGAITSPAGGSIAVAETSTGTLTLGGSGSSSLTSFRATGSGTVVVNGQTVTVSGSSSFGASGARGSFTLQSGSLSFNGGLTTNANVSDSSLFLVSGGTFSAASLTMHRTQSFTTLPTAAATGTGFVVSGGTATITGAMIIGASNSSASALVSGSGSLVVGGQVTIGNTSNTRYSVIQVKDTATFTSTDATNGIVLSPSSSTANNSELLLTGGTTTAERIGFGASNTAAGASGTLKMTGGSLYMGSGGLVMPSVNAYTATIDLSGGATVGAKADWSSSLGMNLSGAATFKAADINNVAHNVSLSGALGGATGSLTKTGNGTLTLSGTNTYGGGTTVSGGTLLVSGSITGSTAVNSGGTLGGAGSVGTVTLNADGAIQPGGTTGGPTASSLTWNGETSSAFAQMKFSLSSVDSTSNTLTLTGALTKGTGITFAFDFSGGGVASGSYTLLNFGSSSGFSASDFSYSNLGAGLTGNFSLQSNSLTFTVVPEPNPAAMLLAGGICLPAWWRIRRRRA